MFSYVKLLQSFQIIVILYKLWVIYLLLFFILNLTKSRPFKSEFIFYKTNLIFKNNYEYKGINKISTLSGLRVLNVNKTRGFYSSIRNLILNCHYAAELRNT